MSPRSNIFTKTSTHQRLSLDLGSQRARRPERAKCNQHQQQNGQVSRQVHGDPSSANCATKLDRWGRAEVHFEGGSALNQQRWKGSALRKELRACVRKVEYGKLTWWDNDVEVRTHEHKDVDLMASELIEVFEIVAIFQKT